MDQQLRIHWHRLALLLSGMLTAALCFIPVGKVPLVWTLHAIVRVRIAALALCALAAVLAVFGRWRRELWLPFRIVAFTVVGAAALFCLFRVVVLAHRALPTFADDDPEAAPYYEKACDAGEMDACTALGACYWTGTCKLPKNQARGLSFFQKACDGGDMAACGQLGICYESGGCGLIKSGQRAVAYYEKACDGGDMGMCNNLGICYYKGECGLGKDDAQAAALYKKACSGGDSGACHNLDLMKD